jgi:hypothetical protein
VSVRVDSADFSILRGNLCEFTKTADSGHRLTRHFCGECGSPIFTSSARHPDTVYVKAGAFDDPDIVSPAYQSWTDSMVEWAAVPEDLVAYRKGRA